jgi:hypothetical protein
VINNKSISNEEIGIPSDKASEIEMNSNVSANTRKHYSWKEL